MRSLWWKSSFVVTSRAIYADLTAVNRISKKRHLREGLLSAPFMRYNRPLLLNTQCNLFSFHQIFGKIKGKEIVWNSIRYWLEWRDFVQWVKIGVQSRGKGRCHQLVVCFFLCPDSDCSRTNLFFWFLLYLFHISCCSIPNHWCTSGMYPWLNL